MARRSSAHPEPVTPGPGQESVWDYPRPPRLEASDHHVGVRLAGTVVADTRRALRVLETSHPPSWYLPPGDCDMTLFSAAPGSSFCEWKGMASYWTVTVPGATAERMAWSYPEPSERFIAIRDHVAFYPSTFDCTVDGEVVRPQPGTFYGGWVTDDVVGPFKGEPGTMWW
jgi:uncharacterized protein (DUF427 family)